MSSPPPVNDDHVPSSMEADARPPVAPAENVLILDR